jgi:hypothetical protein
MPPDDAEDSDQSVKNNSVHRDARDSAEQPERQSRVTLLEILIVLSCCNEGVSGSNEFVDCEISRFANRGCGLSERGQTRVCDVAISLKVRQSTRKVPSREHDYRTDGQRSKRCIVFISIFYALMQSAKLPAAPKWRYLPLGGRQSQRSGHCTTTPFTRHYSGQLAFSGRSRCGGGSPTRLSNISKLYNRCREGL